MGVRIGTLVSMSDPLFSSLYMCVLNVMAAAYTPFVPTPSCDVSAVTAVGNSTFWVQSCCRLHPPHCARAKSFPKTLRAYFYMQWWKTFIIIKSSRIITIPQTILKICPFLTWRAFGGCGNAQAMGLLYTNVNDVLMGGTFCAHITFWHTDRCGLSGEVLDATVDVSRKE